MDRARLPVAEMRIKSDASIFSVPRSHLLGHRDETAFFKHNRAASGCADEQS